MKLSNKSRQILTLISKGHSYEQILSLHRDFTYKDIFSSAQEALELENPSAASYQDRLAAIKQKYPNAYEPWTQQQEELLRELHGSGAAIDEMAAALKRQQGAVSSRIRKLGLEE